MINILMPMAGQGSRLKNYFDMPKPLVKLNDRHMFLLPLEPIEKSNNFIFVVLDSHKQYGIEKIIKHEIPKAHIVYQKEIVKGAVESALLAEQLIDDHPLLIVDCDIFADIDFSGFVAEVLENGYDGGVVTHTNNASNYSYVSLKNSKVIEVAEKRVISNNAISGMYFWKSGKDFIKYAKKMINANADIETEFYISMVINEAIKDQKIFLGYNISRFYHMGTIDGINSFLNGE